MIKILVDTTYLLPTFGIAVKKLREKDLMRLREIRMKELVKYYCLDVIWVELIGKVHKEMEKQKCSVDRIIELAIRSLEETDFYEWISVPTEAIILASKLRKIGHKDVIDNILYATAVVKDVVFLSMDNEFKKFLESNNLDSDRIKSHNELLSIIKMK